MKIKYTKVGDYYLPNLYYPEETRPIGFWGMLRKEYLKEHKPGTYTYLLQTARLDRIISTKNAMKGIASKEMYIRGFLDYERLVCEKDGPL